jgi:uncharacterized protein
MRHNSISMARYQQRRARFAAIAAAIVVVLYLAFFRSQDASVTWHLPIPTPTQTPTSVKEQAPIDALSSSTGISSVPTTSQASPKLPTSSPATERPESAVESPNKPKTPPKLPAIEKPDTSAKSSNNASSSATPELTKSCVSYMALQRMKQEPLSEGSRKFPYQRPSPECRTFNLPAMESLIERMKSVIKDPDLFRLFENSYPNTLDTMIKWRGYAQEEESEDQVPLENASTLEELTYVITGDVWFISLRTWNIAPFVSNLAPNRHSARNTDLIHRLMLCGCEIQHPKSTPTYHFLKRLRILTHLPASGGES